MNSIFEACPIIISISWIILGAISSIYADRYLNYFKEKYPHIWESLGKPGYVLDSTFESRKALEGFEKNKEYIKLNDPVFNKLLEENRIFKKTMDVTGIIASIVVIGFILLSQNK